MSKNYDVIIIGGGIVGLATAYQILKVKPNISLLILEKEDEGATHQSMRNSGVIHSGIYYKEGSKKAKYCIGGYKLLIDYCNKNSVNYNICGKLIVANNKAEDQKIKFLYNRGINNGLDNLEILGKDKTKEIEPFAKCTSSLYVPQTGIINYKELANSYLKNILLLGGKISFRKKVIDIKNHQESSSSHEVICNDKTYICNYLISCAGLQSDRLAMRTNPYLNMRIIPFKGEYFMLKENSQYLVNNLIYPVPDTNFPFLGVHFTKLVNGGVECGPNAILAFSREGYQKYSFNLNDFFSTMSWSGFYKLCFKYYKEGFNEYWRSIFKKAFVTELQKLVPSIKSSDLYSSSSGIRAQACDKNGKLLDDFVIIQNKNIVHVVNAPSPAATSSLSIGYEISKYYLKNSA